MMTTIRLILGDQLSTHLSSLRDIQNADVVLLCEVLEEATYVPHHPKKLVFVFSAMRHFAQQLTELGHQVDYQTLGGPISFTEALQQACQTHQATGVIVTAPGEHRVLAMMQTWSEQLQIPVEIRPDDRFLCSTDAFNGWCRGRRQPRMETFYRMMRQKHRVLMDDRQPCGGQWNFDKDNRHPPKDDQVIAPPHQTPPDAITQEVMALVKSKFPDHFGELELFDFAVTDTQARQALQYFIQHHLPDFGTYQDAMLTDQPWMHHARIGLYLNIGLLSPWHCIEQAEAAYRTGHAPINAVEGFIRQILGWREYIRGIYWYRMPGYEDHNFFKAQRPLPQLYWDAQTPMNCLHQCVKETQRHAYAHHIQRLMVLGNFALLTGIDPKAVQAWFLAVYADAYEWVELPNVSGMALFADGGFLASKPYAAGGGYIHRMSDYCKNCHFNVKQSHGEQACPMNYLYWNFLIQHREQLQNHPRMRLIYSALNKMSPEKIQAIQASATDFLQSL